MQLLGEMFYKCQFNKLVDTVVQIIYICYFLPTYSINYWVFSVLLVFVSCNLKLLGVNTFRMVPVSLPVSSIKKTFSEFSAYLSECLVGFIEKNPITVQNPPILHLQGLNPFDSLHSVFGNLIKTFLADSLIQHSAVFVPGKQCLGLLLPVYAFLTPDFIFSASSPISVFS